MGHWQSNRTLGIILHTAWGNAIITFFMPFDPAPCDKKSRSEHQTLFPLFGEGSGHETSIDLLSTTHIPLPLHPHTPLPPLTLPTCTDTSVSVSRTVFNLIGQVGNDGEAVSSVTLI